MWKNKASCKLVLSCGDGKAQVDFHADLGQPDGQHVHHHDLHPLPLRRKTPAQLRRSDRRKQEFLRKKREVAEEAATKDEDKLAATKVNAIAEEVIDNICSDETYKAQIENEVAMKETIVSVEGEFHSHFPFKEFKQYIAANLAETIEHCVDYGYWFEENYTGFFATLKLKSGITTEHLLNMSIWPKVIKNLKINQDYGPK